MIDVFPIPAFDDNYIWCLTGGDGGSAGVVDPGDADPVLEYLSENGLVLSAILVTHKHGDHVGGVRELLEAFPGIPVFGPRNEPISSLTERVGAGDKVELPEIGAQFEVMDVPGHTEGYVAYFGHGMLFCGDTLFAAGCGRVFSGTHERLHHSLMAIASLPGDTLVYCAHEYTLANLGFAKWVEPDSEVLAERIHNDSERRKAGKPTVPSLLSLEKETNPFLRTAEAHVIAAAEKYAGRSLSGGTEVFTAVRTWKDREYD
ncbi:hydroxyacylglutathione hydrolase [Solemya velum gill symbiont]|uniref:Hydroxyacylglutathione hydrolase n=1 Tax=Solemya velum gill symbiont TaxID=2340 RepID=A0A1T2DHJ7_SOVGS|nr:hydroxyacylglutathione hydrolase [Solemya velum gill symbiont]OOY35840.1 hydroxyacylglutathione hydrolase [Solemya velum gill symbiont]OOY38680.1 hydroxyacylglutathione hydrolase [Solemya velum gill symbiont]OOY40346.1 hydroxyacylglutathione hydrolase [Solemya velum gill symbiont]OOY46557.1 hydroxyacylglutathione hydrolase [Solemya velum gill symbiont]OOY53452.1 hydroxyacylglutathione hydrolase [Solemya velum gill symbiont]